MVWTLAACGVDLDREAGSLQVQVRNLDAGVDGLRLRVRGPDMDPYGVVIPVQSSDVDHAISSVPVGTVEVAAVAERSGRDVAVRTQVGQVVARTSRIINLDFGSDDPRPTSRSLSFTGTADPNNVTGERLRVTLPFGSSQWMDFVSTASEAPSRLEVVSLELSLLDRNDEVESLQDVWEGPVDVDIQVRSDARSIGWGRANLTDDVQSIAISPLATAEFESIHDALLEGETDWIVEGDSDLQGPAVRVRLTGVFRWVQN